MNQIQYKRSPSQSTKKPWEATTDVKIAPIAKRLVLMIHRNPLLELKKYKRMMIAELPPGERLTYENFMAAVAYCKSRAWLGTQRGTGKKSERVYYTVSTWAKKTFKLLALVMIFSTLLTGSAM